MGKYQKNIEAARSVTIMQYLATCHPGELVRKTDDEYCTKTHSSLVITPSKDLFHWFSQNIGGRSALDYMTNVERVDFVSAVRFLNELNPVPVSSQMAKMTTPAKQQESREFELPKADKNCEAVAAYLMHRGISPKVLRFCVNSKILYQTTRVTKLIESNGKATFFERLSGHFPWRCFRQSKAIRLFDFRRRPGVRYRGDL